MCGLDRQRFFPIAIAPSAKRRARQIAGWSLFGCLPPPFPIFFAMFACLDGGPAACLLHIAFLNIVYMENKLPHGILICYFHI
ncbi:hypothetical protein GJA_5339 [Janthinobacterium agaricidamnosum NBRC 102515 = DSM 9628]|uniref:Uncharacterized protein n=1 Tax=Janthinobacterium agaricidamnosum NBRC 102515 = DSM 9628 TaxID=1349767 RepID=W0VE46_9BURK|nr:hypothetical protein GJA_5339 [Janthinobacterium agaricidamnosum NBRC 102515 = DSM 9628]